MTAALRFPAGVTSEGFLRDYWQQAPLLLRQALPRVANPLSPEELAGLACEPDIESRLIVEQGESPWQVRYGPFDETDFAALPDTHWTLLVQDVDKHVPAAASLLDAFAFLPRWRLDDLMISYASDQGSVGPHLDAYDVFLVQTLGRRRWRISSRHYGDEDLLPDLDIRVLRRFDAQQEWLLEPGDVLYLPPGVAHWGIAEGEHCMTCSVGFRSPSQRELAASWFEHLLEHSSEQTRYRDPDCLPGHLGGQIPTQSITQVRALLEHPSNWSDAELSSWFGRFITEPKPHLAPEPPERLLAETELRATLDDGARLRASPVARLAYSDASATPQLFADGERYGLRRISPGLAALCDRQAVGRELLGGDEDPLLTALYNQGSLVWLEDEHDVPD